MLYFIVQTLLLSLCVFIIGLFVGIFLKNLWCKKKRQAFLLAKSRNTLKKKGRRNSSLATMNVHTTQSYSVNRQQSAAIAKKRTMALVGEGRASATR